MNHNRIKIIDQIPNLTTEQASAAFSILDFVLNEIWHYHGSEIARREPPRESPIYDSFEDADINSIF